MVAAGGEGHEEAAEFRPGVAAGELSQAMVAISAHSVAMTACFTGYGWSTALKGWRWAVEPPLLHPARAIATATAGSHVRQETSTHLLRPTNTPGSPERNADTEPDRD